MNMFSRAAALTPARPEEILRQVNPWWILLTCFLGLLANISPASGLDARRCARTSWRS